VTSRQTPHPADPGAAGDLEDPRSRILEACIDILAADGLQGLSHRSVEARAGVSHGSTTYYFKTRSALIDAVLEHLADTDAAVLRHALDALSADGQADPANASGARVASGARDAAGLRDAVAGMLGLLAADRRTLLARFELFLYAARQPRLQAAVAHWRQGFIDVGIAVLGRHGDPDPEGSARFLGAALDGILLHQLSAPSPVLERSGIERIEGLVSAARRKR